MTDTESSVLDILDIKSRCILKENIDLDQRVIHLNTGIGLKSLDKLTRSLSFLESIGSEPITIVINSPGGSIYDAFAIIDRIQNSSCVIITVGTGLVASAAIPILASGNIRKATKHCSLMYHEPSFNMPLERLAAADSETKHVKYLSQRLNKFMAASTDESYSYWVKAGKYVDFYFDADKALELGIIDEIVQGAQDVV